MNAAQWHRVKTLLDAALDRPAEKRAAFLEKACPDDETLREEVASLLAAHDDEATHFLSACGTLGQSVESVRPPRAEPLKEGAQVGPYRLTGVLGRGGMGTVYRAVRADAQYERVVALKVIHPALRSEAVVRRFRAERQILASLEHPHIARLYDGGLTTDERPYFVMERVEGTPLVRYSETEGLTLTERLRLFEDVAQAVAHAHRALVVHRDLKPSHILVTAQGEPKLLDFGIAKLLRAAPSDAAPLTRPGQSLMTPEYAAPEQVRGAPVTPATDVYALGVILYELLAGRRPYRFENRTPSHIERVVCETEPAPPSTASPQALGDPDTPSERSPTPRPPTHRLRPLRGDLDRIVMKALRKEPGRRYASAAELADDLRRHREGLPIKARPATWRYRAGKFVRRHRWGVAAATVLVLLLVGYAATVTVQSRRIAAERDRARTEAEKAQQVSAFLTDLFESSYPGNAQGEVVTARELLRRGLRRADTLSSQPAAQAEMLYTIGNAHRKLNLYDEAESALRRALSLRQSLFDAGHPDLTESLEGLALFLRDRGQYAAADSLLQSTVASQKAHYGEIHEAVATSLKNLTYVQRVQGHYAEAEGSIREALTIRQALHDGPHMSTAEVLYNLAAVLRDQHQLSEAEAVQRRSLQMARTLSEGPHPGVAANLNNLAILRKQQGDLEEAATLYRQALQIDRALYGEKHSETATVMSNLASVRTLQGKYDVAARLHRQALATYRELYGVSHPHIATALHDLGTLHKKQGRLAHADSLYRQALAMRRDVLGEGHPRTAADLVALGQLAHRREHLQKAETYLREGLRAYADRPTYHAEVAQAKSALGAVLVGRGSYAAAEPLLQAAHTTIGAQEGPRLSELRKTIRHLVQLYETQGQPEQAAAWRDSLRLTQNLATASR